MPESNIGMYPDGTGKKLRMRQRVIGADTIQEQFVLLAHRRVISGEYSVATPRTLGTAATPQNIASIENPTGSGLIVAIRKLYLVMDSTAVLVSVAPSIQLSRPAALPTGGTSIVPVKHDSAYGAAASIVRAGTASDGGAATAITATAGSPPLSTALTMRLHTAVGQVLQDRMWLIDPSMEERDHIILAPGESVLVQGVVASAATTHFVVNATIEEYTLP